MMHTVIYFMPVGPSDLYDQFYRGTYTYDEELDEEPFLVCNDDRYPSKVTMLIGDKGHWSL